MMKKNRVNIYPYLMGKPIGKIKNSIPFFKDIYIYIYPHNLCIYY